MDEFTEIDFLEFKELKVQAIVSIFDCKQNDMFSVVNIAHDPGSIKLYKNSGGRRYIAMYASVSSNYEESIRTCLINLAEIKNLKRVAFPKKLVTNSFTGIEAILKKFAVCNPNIKVYILRENVRILGVKDKNAVENKDFTSPYLSFGDLLGQIKVWKNNKSGWALFFVDRIEDKTIATINKFLQDESKKCAICPEPKKIFNAMILTKLVDVKVIIIGQDPYHTPGAAMGLSFSHEKDCKKIQPSLQNIYKELISCGYKVNAKSGDLTKWAQQGVFLINTALTVQQGKANSHSKEWEKFTEKLFTFMNEKIKRSVVIMWGAHAQSYEKYFDATRHKMIKSPHPSPFSAHTGFFGSKPFVVCNNQLKKWGIEEIDWNLNVEEHKGL